MRLEDELARLEMQKTMVIFAWGITFIIFFSWHWFGGNNFIMGLIPYLEFTIRAQTVFWWLFTFLASTATALALGLKSIFLALPGFLFPPLVILILVVSGKFIDARPLYASLLFFLFFSTCGPLLIRSYKDEKKRHKIYQGALLVMLLLAVTFLFLPKWFSILSYLVGGDKFA